jgi:hypothetical protein
MNRVQISILLFLISCGRSTYDSNKNEIVGKDTILKSIEHNTNNSVTLSDKTVLFLWREHTKNPAVEEAYDSIIVNESFIKTITEPQRAAIAYVATYIGNECDWDGAYKDDRSNLKCKILTALNLGYQCSDQHLGYLRKMFKNDPKVLEEFTNENCPTIPNTATIQDTFDEIILQVKGDSIIVKYKASGVNLRDGDQWSWTEKNFFLLDGDHLKLVNKEKSKVTRVKR